MQVADASGRELFAGGVDGWNRWERDDAGRLVYATAFGEGDGVTSDPLPIGGEPVQVTGLGLANLAERFTVAGAAGQATPVAGGQLPVRHLQAWAGPVRLDLPAGWYPVHVEVVRNGATGPQFAGVAMFGDQVPLPQRGAP